MTNDTSAVWARGERGRGRVAAERRNGRGSITATIDPAPPPSLIDRDGLLRAERDDLVFIQKET
ncbi:MAG: hypothetical protein R8G01_16270 [Ilumatobacteraceae bacterium]|nr:hypothetical protein [Ilumatobacteraceae bacterium]